MLCFGSHCENGRHFENFEMQICSSNGDLSLCKMLCLNHYLEVININVRNFNFPIGFYSNPHPL